ncbi:MAG: thiol peroxidase [Alphaproteobacteria bacterium]
MASITFKGSNVNTSGYLPVAGTKAPDFTLTTTALSDVTLKSFVGKKVVLNIFPSLDTPVCANTVRKFNEIASKKKDVIVICISDDLPFAHQRFCVAEKIDNVIFASEMRNKSFGQNYGIRITNSVLEGLLARAVLVIDETGRIKHSQLVTEITDEPDYDAVLSYL